MISLREWNYLRLENYLGKKYDLGYIESSNIPAFLNKETGTVQKKIRIQGSQGKKQLSMVVKIDEDKYIVNFN